jgi:siroheme synthase-like protein
MTTVTSAPPFGYPIFVEVRGRRVVVVGDGPEARHKARGLAELGADVVRANGADFDPAVLEAALLVIVSTGHRDRDREIATVARERGLLVNTVDDIPYCDWSAPAILRRGDLTIAVGTGGVAPALAVRLRDRLAGEIGDEFGELLRLFADVRPAVMATNRPFADRRSLWYDLVDGPALEHLRAGRTPEARRAIEDALAAWETGR